MLRPRIATLRRVHPLGRHIPGALSKDRQPRGGHSRGQSIRPLDYHVMATPETEAERAISAFRFKISRFDRGSHTVR